MSVSTHWKNLTSVALLGTERQNLPSSQGTALEGLLTEGSSKEETLLDAAATASLYLRLGWQPTQEQLEFAPSPTDTLPVLSKEMHECFVDIMRQDSSHTALRAELFQLMSRVKVRPERGWVYRVLEEAKKNPELRADALKIIGERGRWLAKFIPFGEWVLPSELSENLWDEGKLNERVAFLKQLRGTDTAKARALLEESWHGEASEARADLLGALEINLSLDDEPFLESCLEDKKKDVRKTAAMLLNSLADSKLVQRMTERAKRFVTYKPAGMLGLKKAQIEITLPETFEKDWAKDGLEQKSVPYGMGEKAWWLRQMLERVPPSIWGEPKLLLNAMGKEWAEMLRQAWRTASLTFGEVSWAKYYLEHYQDDSMMYLLPSEDVQALLLERLSQMQGPIISSDLLWILVTTLPKPWSPSLEEALLKRVNLSLLNWSKIQNTYPWQERNSLQVFGQTLPVSLLYAIPKGLEEKYQAPDHPLHDAFREMLTTLELRANMHSLFGE